jgi:hypothetical protein
MRALVTPPEALSSITQVQIGARSVIGKIKSAFSEALAASCEKLNPEAKFGTKIAA